MSNILQAIYETIPQLRSSIEIGLGDEIGFYEFPNGVTDKAIAVLGIGSDQSGEYPLKGTKITGLEVVIYTSQTVRIERRLDGIVENLATVITLKQFDETKNTLTPLFKLLDLLDIGKDPVRTLRDPFVGNIEVCQLEVIHSFYTEFK